MELHISPTTEATAQAAAATLVELLRQAIEERNIARIALAGGRTPRILYRHLADEYHDRLDWSRVEFYFGDERLVPLDHPDSNFHMAQENLFKGLQLPNHQLFPMLSNAQHDPEQNAWLYEKSLYRWAAGDVPRLDIALLGMGEDGHFASLFPDTPALDERERLVVVNPVEKLHSRRLTMTFPMFLAARHVIFLVTGKDKSAALLRVRDGDFTLPAGQLMQQRDGLWFVDAAATETSTP